MFIVNKLSYKHTNEPTNQLTQNGPWDDALEDWLRIEIALCGCSAAQSNRTSGLAWNALFLVLAVVASWNFGFNEGPFPFLGR